jgi:hypothetical protein
MVSKCIHKKNFRVLTPRDNSAVHRCNWCGGEFTDRNERSELIQLGGDKDWGLSVGIMCGDCYHLLIMLPKDYWAAHAIWSKKLREASDRGDNEEWDRLYKNSPEGVRNGD